jgi:S-layer family protein
MYRVKVSLLALAACIAAAIPAAAESPRCAAVANSPLAEPDWYLEECLGGVPPAREPAPPSVLLPPGDLFWLHNIRGAGQFPMSVYTSPIPTYAFTVIGANTRPIFAMDWNNAATTLHAIANGSTVPPISAREYGTYDLATGAFVAQGVPTGIPAAETISGLKFDPTSTTVYVNSTINLYTFDVTTGVATLVGPFTHAAAAVIDIAISPTGQMFGEDLNDNFYSINKATGATTLIGPTGFAINFAQGMDFDNGDGTLYQFAYAGGGVNDLRRIDTTTGVSSLVQVGPAGPEHEGSVRVPNTIPLVALEPTALSVDSTGNNVLQPNETNVRVAPSWRNPNAAVVNNVTGSLGNFTGPSGAAYLINDNSAAYGNIAASATQSCGADCYAVTITAATRPSTHWDTSVDETITPTAPPVKTWTLHVGDSFADVPATNPFFRFIETLLHRGVTGGCTQTNYCPGNSTTREQMAVFALISKEGPTYLPPACAPPNLFNDVPETSPFCRWIEELATRGVVSGCGNGAYCPGNPVSREQMAIFVLKTLDPALVPPACAPPNLYADVPETSPFCRWIEELTTRGVVSGCGGGNYCPTAPVTREQMGVFLGLTFSLTLYGV